MFKIKQIIEEHKGFISLIIKSVIYILLLSLFFMWGTKFIFDKIFYLSGIKFWLKDIIGNTLFLISKYALIAIALFFVAYREKLVQIKNYAFSKKDAIRGGGVFLIFTTLFFITRYLLSYTIVGNYKEYLLIIFLLKYLSIIGAVVSLAFAIYSLDFLKQFIKDFWKEMLLVFVLTIVIYNAVIFIRGAWQFLSKIVTLTVSFFLAATFDEVRYSVLNPESPTITVGDFGVIIGSPCSGIDGMSLFTMLFMMMLVFDWSRVNKVKAFLIFPIGAMGMFCMNILRVYSLMVVGKTISVDFAIGAFHSNIGWILFITYFLTFLYFVYPYLVKKST